MELFFGQSLAQGLASGTLYILPTRDAPSPSVQGTPAQQLLLAQQGILTAKNHLASLADAAMERVGQDGADIFHAQGVLLDDPDLWAHIQRLIEGGFSAKQALVQAGDAFVSAFSALSSDYFRTRGEDIQAVIALVSETLSPEEGMVAMPDDPIILAADAITPAQLLLWGKNRLLGLLLRRGGAGSHTAILARAMGIPTLANVDFSQSWHGHTAILNTAEACVILDPTQEQLCQMANAPPTAQSCQQPSQDLEQLSAINQEGQPVQLYANVSSVAEAALALAQGAQGIGLLRSEFLFFERTSSPDEEEQLSRYKQILDTMAGRPVVIRTLDAGGDKPIPYLHLPREENPALGLRGLRLSLRYPALFKTQLRAILRASTFGAVSVLFPMVTSLWELEQAKQLLAQCRRELGLLDIPSCPVGVMIETPAAALLAHQLAKEVDFFSLGTNDLTQYTLAADRENPDVAPYYTPNHPAVMALIELTVAAARAQGISLCLCGEMAADPSMTQALLRLGIEQFSLSPFALLPIKQKIGSLSLQPIS